MLGSGRSSVLPANTAGVVQQVLCSCAAAGKILNDCCIRRPCLPGVLLLCRRCLALPSVAAWVSLLYNFGSRYLMHELGSTSGVWHLLSGRLVSSLLHFLQSDGYFMRRAA